MGSEEVRDVFTFAARGAVMVIEAAIWAISLGGVLALISGLCLLALSVIILVQGAVSTPIITLSILGCLFGFILALIGGIITAMIIISWFENRK